MNIKKIIPQSLKTAIKNGLRQQNDRQKGYWERWAKPSMEKVIFPNSFELKQRIVLKPTSENKIINIQRVSDLIEPVTILPQQIFSFWRCVGTPNKRNGFKKGRNIIAGKLQESYGGGLCQISGMIYHLSLIAGLEILERHNHSMDIYEESERFTPLGADATVVYGYKDLRIINNQNSPIRFTFIVTQDEFIGQLQSLEKIVQREILFERKYYANKVEVITQQLIGGQKTILNRAIYATFNLPQSEE